MKVLTIKQPWASLIAEGYKEYEFRSWKTNFRGEILIHAGIGIDKKALEKFKHLNIEYPTGCIIAKATITDCISVEDKFSEKLLEKDHLVYNNLEEQQRGNKYAFKLESIEKTNKVPAKGKLSLWEYKGNINELFKQ